MWSREHYKSTIITFAKSIQDILASHGDDPIHEREFTLGIFSFNRPTAKKFLKQIKYEFENNHILKTLFSDVLWDDPEKQAPTWSLDEGIIVRRKGNPKEPTIGAHGLIDSMPTGVHYFGRIYDDVITEKFARTPDMIEKSTESWALSINLGARGGFERYIGTRYHANDTYRTILNRDVAIPRIYAATNDGTPDGEPVFVTQDELDKKRRAMGPYVFACQMLQNPMADEKQGFKQDWVRFHQGSDGKGLNIYIIVDPANEKKKTSDYTAIEVIGLGPDSNYYTLDLVRDRLNLRERADAVFSLHRKWKPIRVGYEKYGMQADIDHIKDRMSRENYHFDIVELKGPLAKNDRIKKLIPLFEQGRWYMPQTCFKTDYEGKTHDLVDVFIHQEFLAFPVPVHDDMLDAKARILDEELGAIFPKEETKPDRYAMKYQPKKRGSAWSN